MKSATQRTPLSRRSFSVVPFPISSTETSSRHLKRIHVAAEILKAVKICAGDVLVLRDFDALQEEEDEAAAAAVTPEGALAKLSLKEPSEGTPLGRKPRVSVGVAWPSFTLSGNSISVSPLVLENAGLSTSSHVSVTTLQTSNVTLLPCTFISLSSSSNYAASKQSSQALFEAFAREVTIDIRYLTVGHSVSFSYNGSPHTLTVLDASPAPSSPSEETAWTVTRNTKISFAEPPTERDQKEIAKSKAASGSGSRGVEDPWDTLGGMSSTLDTLRELIEWPLTRPELFSHFHLRPPRGILLHGPPGTGKTLLAHTLSRALNTTLFTIDGGSLSSPFHGGAETQLRSVFAEAAEAAPSLIVIDEIDAIAPNREEGGEVDRRVVGALLTLMDGLGAKNGSGESAMGGVVVIAATNRPNAIDPALRRPGRFDKEIEIGVPDAPARLDILRVMLRHVPHSLTPDDLAHLSSITHGFVGADLSSLIHSACLNAIRHSPHNPSSGKANLTSTPLPTLTLQDILTSLLSIRPSAMREVFLETPKVLWSDIGGQETVKERLRECVEWPLRHADTFKRLGVRPPRGVLLYGPPGCSKTLIAKALATEGGLNFIAVKGPEIFNKYVGESERAVRELFRKARAAAPSIVFLDEVDSLAPARGSDDSGGATSDRVLMSLLTEMDGIEELNGVMVLAATNRPDVIDPALMRPGRLDRILYVAPPDEGARREIFKTNFSKMQVDPEVDLDELVTLTDGCSGAELVSVCQDAALATMKEDLEAPHVRREDLLAAAKGVRRRITREMVLGYEEWRDSSGLRSA